MGCTCNSSNHCFAKWRREHCLWYVVGDTPPPAIYCHFFFVVISCLFFDLFLSFSDAPVLLPLTPPLPSSSLPSSLLQQIPGLPTLLPTAGTPSVSGFSTLACAKTNCMLISMVSLLLLV